MPMKRKKKLAELDLDAIPAWLDPDIWTDFFENRKDLGEPMTPRAVSMMVRKLERLHDAGHDVHQCITTSIIKGWTDVYPPREPVAPQPQQYRGAVPSMPDAKPGESMEAYEARKREQGRAPRQLFH